MISSGRVNMAICRWSMAKIYNKEARYQEKDKMKNKMVVDAATNDTVKKVDPRFK